MVVSGCLTSHSRSHLSSEPSVISRPISNVSRASVSTFGVLVFFEELFVFFAFEDTLFALFIFIDAPFEETRFVFFDETFVFFDDFSLLSMTIRDLLSFVPAIDVVDAEECMRDSIGEMVNCAG